MSFYLARFFRPTSRTFPAVFFSSTSKLFDNALTLSREKVKAILKEQGFTGTINHTGTDFNKKDLQALKVSFQPALKCNVIPCNKLQDNLAIEKYILPNIDSDTLTSRKFDVDQLKEISDDQVKTFLTDVHAILKNLGSDEGMDESMTDILLNNLLVQIIGLHKHPLKVSIQPRCRLYIADEPYVTAHPEFVVTRKDVSMVVVEDKHLRNTCLTNPKGFGEAQLASEILACGSENMRQILRKTGLIPDQTIFGIRAISTYFTFYKTVISKEYWNELDFSLPQTESVVIERWPEGERPENGLDIAEPNGRREVLDALARIRQFILQ